MKKIAIDIDDVLSANAEAFVAYSNRKWGLNLTVDDYDERWGRMWKTEHDREETIRRSVEMHKSGMLSAYRPLTEAMPVLRELHSRFELVIVTSRKRIVRSETEGWIVKHYGGLFSDIHYAGMYDNPTSDSLNATKAKLCREIDADFLIDDQLKHCVAAAEAGIPSVLFGRYSWNRAESLPDGVTRCNSWGEVKAYFEGQ